ncbi:NRT [Mytilus edulis]|uniref:NRT n=1 Tax=Mytilus edulis TaxID=6550 RepID=A0A8S3VM06_MYTED|nr:NRT [Mytilus edulis]
MKELNLSKKDVANSGIASVAATIGLRIIVGPLCDKFGPRRIMSALLLTGSIPMALAGLIKNGTGLIVLRLFIGVLGGAFVPCQVWTSIMFNSKIVGTANALVGGWGNLGGGFTFLFMPAIFQLVKLAGADAFLAWKIAVIIPALICCIAGIYGTGTVKDTEYIAFKKFYDKPIGCCGTQLYDNIKYCYAYCAEQSHITLTNLYNKCLKPDASPIQQTTNTQTEARNSVVRHVLTPTKYKGGPVGVVVNRDIVTSPYNPNKACHRLVFYTSTNDRGKRSRIDFEEGFDIDDPVLLRTPPHTSPVINEESKEAMQTVTLAARPDTPYQQHQRSRSITILFTSDDCPQGPWRKRILPEKSKLDTVVVGEDEYLQQEDAQIVDFKDSRQSTGWTVFTVFILFVQYGMCFGVEIATNTVLNLYLLYKFKIEGCNETTTEDEISSGISNAVRNASHINTFVRNDFHCSVLNQNTASLIASLFGLMNLFARALGGSLSDALFKKIKLPGRLIAHQLCLAGEGVMLIIFSQMTSIPSAIATLTICSVLVQASEGTTYSLVPYVNKQRVGVIAGLVGAGGNTGAIIWNTIWVQLVDINPSMWFWILGVCVICGSTLTLFIRIENTTIWHLLRNHKKKISDKEDNRHLGKK